MVDAEERMKGVDAKLLLDKCQTFLEGKWRQITVDDFEFKVLSVGFGNRLFVCKISTDTNVAPVLVRLYGGNVLNRDADNRHLTEVTETLLFYKLGEVNYGPKLLGSFDGGRIEEFISGTALPMKDFATNHNVARALAKVMARYHRLDVPISRKYTKIADTSKDCYGKFLAAHPEWADCYRTPGEVDIDHRLRGLVEFNVIEFTNWVTNVSKLIDTRIVLTHNDANCSNIIIKGDEPNLGSEDLDQRLVLIDIEFSSYSPRYLDIGNAFGMRKFNFAGDKFISGYEYPNEDDRRVFITSYVEDMRDSNHYSDWNEDGIDSVDHILMECEFGAICTRFGNVLYALSGIDGWLDIMEKRAHLDPDFGKRGLNAIPEFVIKKRNEFIQKYPQFDI